MAEAIRPASSSTVLLTRRLTGQPVWARQLAGLAVTVIPAVTYFILLMTADYSPIERRARRMTILASVIVFLAIWSMTASVYTFVSELAGNFLMFPSIGLTAVAVWHVSRITYRRMDWRQGIRKQSL